MFSRSERAEAPKGRSDISPWDASVGYFLVKVTGRSEGSFVPIHAPFLRYFREVARCGSVRLAAKPLYVASSALNRKILKVENELGVKLFERTPTGMVLTPAGALLGDHVERVLSAAERTLTEITSAVRGEARPITITGEHSVLCAFLRKRRISPWSYLATVIAERRKGNEAPPIPAAAI